jgi:hypothetical protein
MANIRFQLLRATKIEWSTKNPILRSGEPGIESDTARLKLGDGSTTWDNLEYVGDDIYNETILATVNLVDIKAGDTIEGKKVTELLKSILSAYIKPTFTSFTANTKTSIDLEIGVPLLSTYNLNKIHIATRTLNIINTCSIYVASLLTANSALSYVVIR